MSSSSGTGGMGTGGGSSTGTGGMGTGGGSSTGTGGMGTGGGSSTGTGGMGTGSSSSTGTGGMAGNCTTAGDCLPTGNVCITATCIANQCGTAMVPSGTAIAMQTAGNCHADVCDGNGAITSAIDNADVPKDGKPCTSDVCAAGVASNPSLPQGTTCGAGLVCDGNGACLGCNVASDCPGMDTACQSRTCTAGACALAFQPVGTAVATQIAGDCKVDQCNGAGAVVSVNDNNDASADGNACTADTCVNGAPSHPALMSGAACAVGGGTVCNGAGLCVQCVTSADCASGVCAANVCMAPVVLSTSPSDGATAVLVTSPLAVTFSGAMSPASLTAQTTSGPCTGSIQASTDDFTTCLAFATAAPTMSLGNTVATLVAAPGLSYGSTFKIRVTTAATGAGSGPIGAQYTSMTGFTTGVAASLTLNESGQPAEADYCVIQFPKTTLTLQTGTATQTIYGRIFEAGLTNPAGAAPGVTAQLGYGPASVNPEWQSGWQFFPATFNVQAGNDDEYQASIMAPAVGNYRYAYRFSQNGTDWTYCDANGAGSNGGLSFEVTQLPSLVVTP
jgi:hypothetical protein